MAKEYLFFACSSFLIFSCVMYSKILGRVRHTADFPETNALLFISSLFLRTTASSCSVKRVMNKKHFILPFFCNAFHHLTYHSESLFAPNCLLSSCTIVISCLFSWLSSASFSWGNFFMKRKSIGHRPTFSNALIASNCVRARYPAIPSICLKHTPPNSSRNFLDISSHTPGIAYLNVLLMSLSLPWSTWYILAGDLMTSILLLLLCQANRISLRNLDHL